MKSMKIGLSPTAPRDYDHTQILLFHTFSYFFAQNRMNKGLSQFTNLSGFLNKKHSGPPFLSGEYVPTL